MRTMNFHWEACEPDALWTKPSRHSGRWLERDRTVTMVRHDIGGSSTVVLMDHETVCDTLNGKMYLDVRHTRNARYPDSEIRRGDANFINSGNRSERP